ncbi:MAG: hypothetical protein ACYTEQ_19185 [Planctomycetota bacterium]|jgi:hypothetical protein
MTTAQANEVFDKLAQHRQWRAEALAEEERARGLSGPYVAPKEPPVRALRQIANANVGVGAPRAEPEPSVRQSWDCTVWLGGIGYPLSALVAGLVRSVPKDRLIAALRAVGIAE